VEAHVVGYIGRVKMEPRYGMILTEFESLNMFFAEEYCLLGYDAV
jgi:hypothetical protein